MELAQHGERLRDRARLLVERSALESPQRMETPMRLAEREQRVVAEGEERSSQGGEHGKLVGRPLDRGHRVPEGERLLAFVIRAAADEHVGNPARLERPDVVADEVLAETVHALEEDTDVPRLD